MACSSSFSRPAPREIGEDRRNGARRVCSPVYRDHPASRVIIRNVGDGPASGVAEQSHDLSPTANSWAQPCPTTDVHAAAARGLGSSNYAQCHHHRKPTARLAPPGLAPWLQRAGVVPGEIISAVWFCAVAAGQPLDAIAADLSAGRAVWAASSWTSWRVRNATPLAAQLGRPIRRWPGLPRVVLRRASVGSSPSRSAAQHPAVL